MTVSSETNRMAEVSTDGSETDFDFDLLIYAADELKVWWKATGGNYGLLTLETDYGVVFTESGGTVSTDGYRAALAAGTLLIIRDIDFTQETNWLYNDNHSEQAHQDDYDRSAIRDLQLQEYIDRCPKFEISSSTVDIAFPEPEAGSFIAWNSDADDLENTSISTIASYVASVLDGTEVPVIGSAGMELLKPGNEAGDDGNWLLVVDSSGDIILRHKESGLWVNRGFKYKGS